MKRKSIDSKAGRFLGIYFAVITLILLWNLFHCTEVSWLTRDAFCEKDLLQEETDTESGSAAAAELVDDHGINVYTGEDGGNGIKSGARLRGVALLGYSNANGLRFLNETVSAQVRRADSGEVLGESIVHVRNQSPYPADETMMYMALSEPVSGTAEESLEISFSSEGLKENGIMAWIAPESIPTGSNYIAEIPRAISSVRAMVLLLTEESQRSRWVQKEAGSAIGAGKLLLPMAIHSFQLTPEMSFLLEGEQFYPVWKEEDTQQIPAIIREVRARLQS